MRNRKILLVWATGALFFLFSCNSNEGSTDTTTTTPRDTTSAQQDTTAKENYNPAAPTSSNSDF